MSLTTTEKVYRGHNNRIDLVLLADSVVPSLAQVTRMTLSFGSMLVDSAQTPAAFNWVSTVSAAEAAAHPGLSVGDPKVIFMLHNSGIPVGVYNAELVVYDPTNALGIVWGTIPIEIV